MYKVLLRPRWILTTLLVILGVAALIRLGIWQLDRLQQRQASNARISAQLSQPALNLTDAPGTQGLPGMEYRSVVVSGEYDLGDQVMLRNQVWEDQPGVHLLTPMIIEGSSQAVLVDRGWVPYAEAESGQLSQYDEKGKVTVRGVIRLSQSSSNFGARADPTLAPGQTRLAAFNQVNLDSISRQVRLPMLPVYIQQAPDPAWKQMPYRSQPVIDLSNGPHLGYALQWFTFALILAGGYPLYIRRKLRTPAIKPAQPSDSTDLNSEKSNNKGAVIEQHQ